MHIVVSFETGGMENGIVNLACRLSSSEFEISVCCLEKSGKSAARLPKNVQVFELNKKPGVSWSTPLKLARLIRKVRPHLLHTHGLGPLIYGAAAVFVGSDVPILHGEHRELYGRDLTKRSLFIRKMLYRRCAGIHTVSKNLKENLTGFGLDYLKTTAIPNGVDCEKFRPGDKAAAKAIFNLPPRTLVLGVVSRIRPEKNIDLLVSAFAELSGALTFGNSGKKQEDYPACVTGDGGPPPFCDTAETAVSRNRIRPSSVKNTGEAIRLLIVGDGPAFPALRSKIAELGLADRVIPAGHRDDTPLCYNAMDLMILPSSAEGLSNAVLEAMACGVPTIASDVCGNSEIITHGHDGLLVEPGNKNALLKTITEAISDTALLKTMGENARKTVFKKFSIDGMVTQYERLYRSIIL